MKKRTVNAIISTLEAAGANIVDDTTAFSWAVMKASADANSLLTFEYGTVESYNYIASQAEVRQLVVVGASTSKETIVASTRYAIMIGNNEQDYESERQYPIVHAYTSAATLSGTPATDRQVVYDALIAKINSYGGNNAAAYSLTYAAYTLGTSAGDAATNFTVSEVVTQETSTETAKVALCTITSGTMAGDDAAGHIWLYDISDEASWLETAKTLTGGTSAVVATVTDATTVHATGIAIWDDAGYFTSKISRGGANYVGIRSGFATDTAAVSIAATYSIGIGTTMLAARAIYDHAKQDLLYGDMEMEFQDGDLPVAGTTYRKYILVTKDGDEDSMGASVEASLTEAILYVEEDSGGTNVGTFHNALAAAAVK